jgi:hypothetical protein
MYISRSSEVRDLRYQAEAWRSACLDTLSQVAVRQSVGPDRADTIMSYEVEAGVVVVDRHMRTSRAQSSESNNGVVLLPVLPEHKMAERRLHSGARTGLFNVGIAKLGLAAMQHDGDLTVVGVRTGRQSTIDRAAALSHEMMHVHQLQRTGQIPTFLEPQALIMREAEAYHVQRLVLEPHYNGQLDGIAKAVEKITGRPETGLKFWVVDRHMARTINASGLVQTALMAHMINLNRGYTPDGVTLPPQSVVDDYNQFGLTEIVNRFTPANLSA